MNKSRLIIIGTGGHAKIIADIIERMNKYEIIGFTAKKYTLKEFYGYPVLGDDSILSKYFESGIQNLSLGVGGYRDNNIRKEIFNKLKKLGFNFVSAIDPSAVVSKRAILDEGNTIFTNVSLNSGVITGKNVIIATNSSIDHDTIIGNNVLISAGVTIGANVRIEDDALIALGAKVISGVTIGKNTIVAAGATVVSNIKSNITVYGTPAKENSKNNHHKLL